MSETAETTEKVAKKKPAKKAAPKKAAAKKPAAKKTVKRAAKPAVAAADKPAKKTAKRGRPAAKKTARKAGVRRGKKGAKQYAYQLLNPVQEGSTETKAGALNGPFSSEKDALDDASIMADDTTTIVLFREAKRGKVQKSTKFVSGR